MSAHHLSTVLLETMEKVGMDRNAKIYEIEPKLIRPQGEAIGCPRDGRKGAAYVDTIHGWDQAGPATHMLSYSWGYAVSDIVDCLLDFCQINCLNPKKTYFWICCLCINQHRVQEAKANGNTIPFEEFKEAFADRVIGCGHLVTMMSPWYDPLYFWRVWCVFEMYTALTIGEDKVTVSIVMPPREKDDMGKALLKGNGLNEVWRVLKDLNIQKAEASVEEDRIRILDIIEGGPGYHSINSSTGKHVQNWIIQTAEQYIEHVLKTKQLGEEPAADLCLELGKLLFEAGFLQRTLGVMGRGRELRESIGMLKTPQGATLLRAMGAATRQTGDSNGALKIYDEARRIRDETGTLETADGADLLRSTGVAMRHLKDLKGSVEVYEEARDILEKIGLLETPTPGGILLSNIGEVKLEMGDIDGAVKFSEQAVNIFSNAGELQTPRGAFLLTNVGDARCQAGNVSSGLDAYHKARRIRELTNTLHTPDGDRLKD